MSNPSPTPAHVAFLDEMAAVSRKLRTLFDARAKEHGLTYARARLLFQLARRDCVTQAELAELLEVEQPTMVRLIDGLERSGLVTREAVEGDRRAKRIVLSEAGRNQAAGILSFSLELRGQVLQGIDEADLAAAIAVLRAMSINICEASAADSATLLEPAES